MARFVPVTFLLISCLSTAAEDTCQGTSPRTQSSAAQLPGRSLLASQRVQHLTWVKTQQHTEPPQLLEVKAKKLNGTSLAGASSLLTETFPHETACFTEGLFMNGSQHEVFESCGGDTGSYLRKYDLRTGKNAQTVKIPDGIFSEGLALLHGRLYMLTYKKHVVWEFDAHTLARTPSQHPFPYGEGWGLTTDGCDLLATTGSSFIYRLRPDPAGTLVLVGKVQVTHRGKPVEHLNEVEYVTPKVWINEFDSNNIWRVDPHTGLAEARLDIDDLQDWHGDAVPNGLAYSTALGPNTLLATGKWWPRMYGLWLSQRDLCRDTTPRAPVCPQAPASACWREGEPLPMDFSAESFGARGAVETFESGLSGALARGAAAGKQDLRG